MGIRDWINKRKAKKQAEQLANVDTSSGGKKENLYVDIDKVNTNTGNDYSYDAGDAQVYVKGGGGGYTPVTVEPKTSQNQIQIQEQNQIQIQEQTKQDLLNQNQKNKIDILRSGAVRQLDERGRYREYVGQAIVGDTGKTANQLQKELREEYKKQTGKVVGQGRLSGTLYTSTPEEIAESLPEPVSLSGWGNKRLTEKEVNKFYETHKVFPSESGAEGTAFIRPLFMNELTPTEEGKQRRKEQFEKVINFLEPIIEKKKEKFENTIKVIDFIDDKVASPFVERVGEGLGMIGSYAISQQREKADKRIERFRQADKIISPISEKLNQNLKVFYQDVSPYAKKGVGAVGKYYVDTLQKQGKRNIQRLDAFDKYVASPFVERVGEGLGMIGSYAISQQREKADKRIERFRQADKIISPISEKLNQNLKVFYQDVKEPVKKASSFIFASIGLTAEQSEKKVERIQDIKKGEQFKIFGEKVKVDKEKGYIGNIYEGTLEASRRGYEDIAFRTGLAKGIYEFKQTDPRPDWVREEAAGSIWNPIEPTRIQEREEAKAFSERGKETTDFLTYFTPIATTRIIGEAAESQFMPKSLKSESMPQNIIEYTKRNKEDVIYVGTLGLLKGAGKGLQYINKPITKIETIGGKGIFKRPLDIISRPTQRITYGKVTREVRPVYSVYDKVTPGYRITETTRLRNLLKKTPKEVKIVKPKYTVSEFKGELISDTTEEGIKLFLRGLETEKRIVKSFDGVKSLGGEGKFRIISSEGSPYKKETFKFLTRIKESSLSKKGIPYTKNWKSYPDTKLLDVITKSKKIATAEQFEILKGGQLSKEFIKGRKISGSISDVIASKQKPRLDITFEGAENIGSQGARSKSSSQFFESLYEQKTIPISEVIKKPIKKTPTPKLEIEMKTPEPQISKWTGTGMYERTESVEMPQKIINVQTQNVLIKPSIQARQEFLTKEISKSKSRSIQKPKQESFLNQKPIQREIQKEKQIQKQRQVQKMSELLVEKNKQITEQTPRIIPPNIETPKIKIPKIPIKIKGSKDVKIIKGINEDKFEVFGRRYGKDIKLTSTESEKKATKELEKFLKGTLGASGFVKKGGKKLDINLGAGFRKSKVDSKRVVQKRSQRLKTRSETSEIKSSKKKIRWF